MVPIVKSLTIREVAEQTGKTWEEVAKEKMKADLVFWSIAISGVICLNFVF